MRKTSQRRTEIISTCLKITKAYFDKVEVIRNTETPGIILELYSKEPLFKINYELINDNSEESIYQQFKRALGFGELFEPYLPKDYINKQFCAVIEMSKEKGTVDILGIYDVDYTKEGENV